MNLLRKYYLVICILIFFIGLITDYHSSSFELVPKQITTISDDGTPNVEKVFTYEPSKKIYSLISDFLYTLAISIFIAFFIINRFDDLQNKNKRIELQKIHEDINTDVFGGVFKKFVPDEIFNAIKTDIIDLKLLRYNARLNFEYYLSQENKICLKQTINYELKNTSHKENQRPYTVFNIIDGDLESCELTHAVCKSSGKNILFYEKTDASKNIGIKESNIDNRSVIDLSFNIPPLNSVDLTLVFNNVYRDKDSANDSYIFLYPVINAELIVSFPHGYKFELISFLSSELELVLKEHSRMTYKANGGILPKQGFNYVLNKVSS